MGDKTYKYETHCHSCQGSACAWSKGADLVKVYHKAGYAGLIMTDHFFNGNTAVDRRLPWHEMVDLFCIGYESALAEAKNLDFDVFFGWEYNFKGTEFLTYGLDKQYLLDHPDLMNWNLNTYFDKVHEAGGFISHAHPFRAADYIHDVRLFPDKVDAVEVANKSHKNPLFDQRALEFATTHQLIQTSGSDTHNANNITGGGVLFHRRLTSISDFIQALKHGEGTPVL